jgi:hypothetical protein
MLDDITKEPKEKEFVNIIQEGENEVSSKPRLQNVYIKNGRNDIRILISCLLFHSYFNYRTTKFLVEEGFYNFHNWFDDRAWYPLGRIIGGTIYPGKKRKRKTSLI